MYKKKKTLRSVKRYYVIQNKDGEFFKPEYGCPLFTDSCDFCERYSSRESANEFLNGKYVTEQFPDYFIGAEVREIRIVVVRIVVVG